MTPHPGFGAFAKEHREFFNALSDDGWAPVEGYAGVEAKVLSGALDMAARRGAMTRLSRWAPGAQAAVVICHDWCEEVFVVSGSLSIGTPQDETRLLPAGTYASRPPEVSHGPFFTRNGCLLLEFHYYAPPLGAAR